VVPNIGGAWILIAAYVVVVVAIIALRIMVLLEMRRRGEQLDRIEKRLDRLEDPHRDS
jgi:uncharacterized protein YoxC